MVTQAAITGQDDLALAWKAASAVVDPEIPVLTIADLGVLRDVRLQAPYAAYENLPILACCAM